MDAKQFDRCTKIIATGSSRRQALQALVGATLGGGVGMLGWRSGQAKPKACKKDTECLPDKVCEVDGSGCVDPCKDEPGKILCAKVRGGNVKSLSCYDPYCQTCKDGTSTNNDDGPVGECGDCAGGELTTLGCLNPCKECNSILECAFIQGSEGGEPCGNECCVDGQTCSNGKCCSPCAGAVCPGPGPDGCPVCVGAGQECCCGAGPWPNNGQCEGAYYTIPGDSFCCGGGGSCPRGNCCTIKPRVEDWTCKECNFPTG
jgi:hypothetical protein